MTDGAVSGMKLSHQLLVAFERFSPGVSRAAAYSACFGSAVPYVYHLNEGSTTHLGLFQDDFFYYAIVADNLARLGRLTFDGITATNGFHPLWFGVVLALRLVTGGLGLAFFAGLAVVLFGAMLASYESLRMLARALGASRALAAPLAAVSCTSALPLIGTGMEVAIAIPLYALLLAEASGAADTAPATPGPPSRTLLKKAVRLGLLASLAILARLDLTLVVALLMGGWLVLGRPRLTRAAWLLAAFGAGGVAVPVYFAYNRLAFGAFLPTSALAKQIRAAAGLSVHFLREGAATYGTRNLALVALAIVALAVLFARNPRARRSARLAAAVALVFPFVFSLLNAKISDWFFFPWYAYPLPVAMLVAFVVLCEWGAPLVRRPWAAAAAACAIGVVLMTVVPRSGLSAFLKYGPGWWLNDNSLLAMALELRDRLPDRSARTLAMGDKAGVTTFVLQRPVVQLEGLVADRSLLEHIRRQESLERVVDEHSIDYLIVSLSMTTLAERDGCFIIEQPNPLQAGSRSARMVGKICARPLAHFYTGAGPHSWSGYLSLNTYVFDLRGETRRTLSAL